MTCEMETEFEEGGGEAEHFFCSLFLVFSVFKVRRFGVGTEKKQERKKTQHRIDANKQIYK